MIPHALVVMLVVQSLISTSVVRELARYLDLNTLDALSRTCRQIRANLIPYSRQLVKRTLRCDTQYNAILNELIREGVSLSEGTRLANRLINEEAPKNGRLRWGISGLCARDMVGECQRCSKIVCRVSIVLEMGFQRSVLNAGCRTARSNHRELPWPGIVYVGFARLAVEHL